MNIGFTGTKLGMRWEQKQTVKDLLIRLTDGDVLHHGEFHHGDCVGADVEAALIAYRLGFKVICHPPINENKRGFFQHNYMVNPSFDYVVRDRHIVNDSRVMIAAPHTSYEIIRSGTWATVRYARSCKRTIYIVTPDGKVTTENT